MQVSGPTGGNLLFEAYDAGTGTETRLVNLSARNFVGTGADVLIVGYTLVVTGVANASGQALAEVYEAP